MKKLALLLPMLALVFAPGCGDPEPVAPANTALTLHFTPMFDGTWLEKKKDYSIGTYATQFQRFTLYVSDIALLKGTEEVSLAEVEFLDFFPDVAGNVAAAPTFNFSVPEGEYTGIKIGFGVKPSLNTKTPSDFAAGHPLSREIEYWPSWKSYIFSKLEAISEIDPMQAGDYESFLNYHCGSSVTRDVYRSHTFTQTISVSGAAKDLHVDLDLKSLFTQASGKMLDLGVTENQYTGTTPSDLGMAEFFMDNWGKAVIIR